VGYKKNSLIGIFRYEDVKRDAYQNAFSGLLGVLRAEKSFGLALGDGTLPFEKYDASSTFYSPLWSEQDVLMFNLAAGQVSLPANQIVAEGELYKMGLQCQMVRVVVAIPASQKLKVGARKRSLQS
jgi:hypothetical protein